MRFLNRVEIHTIFPLFEGALETGTIAKSAFKNWVVSTYYISNSSLSSPHNIFQFSISSNNATYSLHAGPRLLRTKSPSALVERHEIGGAATPQAGERGR